jgi:hypothetical protein
MKMSDGYKEIDERGSLMLCHLEGNEREPETYLVALSDNASMTASLQVAAEWFELSGSGRTMRLNGSQVQTVRAWGDEYL